jgi:hypothetical protein
MNDLRVFASNRMAGLESAYTKLSKNIETIYNDNFVNFYANLENNSKNSKYFSTQREFLKHSGRKFSKFRWMVANRKSKWKSKFWGKTTNKPVTSWNSSKIYLLKKNHSITQSATNMVRNGEDNQAVKLTVLTTTKSKVFPSLFSLLEKIRSSQRSEQAHHLKIWESHQVYRCSGWKLTKDHVCSSQSGNHQIHRR